jgi:hypothetical protein
MYADQCNIFSPTIRMRTLFCHTAQIMWRTLLFTALWMGAGLAFTELTAYGLQYWRLSAAQHEASIKPPQ